MADNKKMSVEDILAACRSTDGNGAGGSANDTPAASTEEAGSGAESQTAATPAKDPQSMSVAEMLAAARSEKSGSEPKAAAPKAAAPKAAAAGASAAAGKKAGEMSVAEMLAAARAEKSGGGAEQPAPSKTPKPAAAKPAAAKPAAKTKAQPAKAAAEKTGPRDTASILAAARSDSKRGPMSKAEAAAKRQPEAAQSKGKQPIIVPAMPEKPAYASPPAPVESAESRRGFFSSMTAAFLGSALAVGFTTLTLTNLLWLLGLARFMFPNILTEPPTVFKVGFPTDYAGGQVQTKFKAEFGVWIVRDEYEGQPQIYALQSVCTHLGCTPNWLEGEQKFKCPCHGSGFYKTGINFEGPAPRPLERFAISLADDGQLEVDKSRKFQEEMGQWKDTSSFVPV